MDDLTRRLHMSKAFLYKQIESKENLVAKILDYLMAKFEQEERLILESELPLPEKLIYFVRAYAKTFIDSDTQEPQQRAAKTNLAAQYAQLQQVLISSRNSEETLNASLRADPAREAQAQTALNLAAKDEARYRELLAADALPAQTYDTYRSKLEDAQAVLTAALSFGAASTVTMT